MHKNAKKQTDYSSDSSISVHVEDESSGDESFLEDINFLTEDDYFRQKFCVSKL